MASVVDFFGKAFDEYCQSRFKESLPEYNPTYSESHQPGRYGNNQQDYVQRSREIIQEKTEWLVKEGPKEGVFRSLYRSLAAKRAEIAQVHQTEDAEDFGKLRQEDPSRYDTIGVYNTPLGGVNEQYEGKFKNWLGDQCCQKIEQMLDEFYENPESMNSAPFFEKKGNGYKVSVSMCPLQRTEKEKKDVDDLMSEFQATSPREEEQYLETWSKKCPDRYQGVLRANYKDIVVRCWKGVKRQLSTLLHVEILLEVSPGKFLSLGGQFMGMTRAIRGVTGTSHVSAIHQDLPWLKETEEYCEQLFIDILNWEPKDGEELLMQKIARFRFVFAYMMPSKRGDGAIGDWLEFILYRYHGYSIQHHPDCLPAFEPLACPDMDVYINEIYPQTVILKKFVEMGWVYKVSAS